MVAFCLRLKADTHWLRRRTLREIIWVDKETMMYNLRAERERARAIFIFNHKLSQVAYTQSYMTKAAPKKKWMHKQDV